MELCQFTQAANLVMIEINILAFSILGDVLFITSSNLGSLFGFKRSLQLRSSTGELAFFVRWRTKGKFSSLLARLHSPLHQRHFNELNGLTLIFTQSAESAP